MQSIQQKSSVTRGLSGARWLLLDIDAEILQLLAGETGEYEHLLRCLINRGVTSPPAVTAFLAPSFDQHLHNAELLRDMRIAVDRLRQAVRKGERIMVVTDFDVDGTTSSVILSTVLTILGAKPDQVSCYVPNRFTEGYGLSPMIVEKAAAEKFDIILTADIGIKSHAEATLARERGIDLIICDHHLPDGEDIPGDAFAVLCPKGSSGTDYPNKDLAACGVALKLADALLRDHPKHDELISSLAKLTAIGSIADMVDVANAENRAIIHHGLRELGKPSTNHGLRALLEIAQVKAPVTTYDIGFKIGPRINAAGRITHASTVLSLFSAPTAEKAKELAHELDSLNLERQQIQQNLATRILEEFESSAGDDLVLLFAGSEGDGYHRGVVGIVSSKLVEKTGRPTFTCAINDEGMAHGSARSISGFHIGDALQACSDLLVKFGGHPMAAGFTIHSSNLEAFRVRLNLYAAGVLSREDLGRVISVDAEIAIEDLTIQFVESLARMEPHGIGNAAPQFLLSRQPIRSMTLMKEKHLKIQLGTARKTIEAVWWNAAVQREVLAGANELSLIFRPEINEWNGRRSVQLKIIDAAV